MKIWYNSVQWERDIMSRPPGVLSETGLYHIIFRGINYQNLFEEKQDYYHNIDDMFIDKR